MSQRKRVVGREKRANERRIERERAHGKGRRRDRDRDRGMTQRQEQTGGKALRKERKRRK